MQRSWIIGFVNWSFIIHNIQEDDIKIQLASLRMEGSTLVWWEAKTQEETKKHGKLSIFWSYFIVSIKRKFYLLAYMKIAIMSWKNFRQLKGQSVQHCIHELRRRALMLGVDLHSQEIFLKYIGNFHSYLKHTILMFNPTSLD